MTRTLITITMILLTGCSHVIPQKGGSASVSSSIAAFPEKAGSVVSSREVGLPNATIKQPDNPNGLSSQNLTFEKTVTIEIPYDSVKKTVTEYPDGRRVTVEEPILAGTKTTEHIKQGVQQQLGGSWYDNAREVGAKLASFQSVQYVGMIVLLIGAVGFAHPVVRALIGGKDTAIVVGSVGLGMVVGPFILVEYSKWFFGLIVIAIAYWFISRLKYKEGIADTLEKSE